MRGPVLATGYRTADGTTPLPRDADGWFATADVGRWGPGASAGEHRLEVLGRADDVIVSGGENVPALAVAALLEQHPAVAEAAVVGVADVRWGTRVVAVVVPVPGVAVPSLDTLRAAVRIHAPAAWAPREVHVVDALPRLANGKLDRVAVRRAVAG